MEMQSKTRVELRLKVKILFKMSNWEKDSGWSRKKNRLITLGHHTVDILVALGIRCAIQISALCLYFSCSYATCFMQKTTHWIN